MLPKPANHLYQRHNRRFQVVTLPQFETPIVGRDCTMSIWATGQAANSLVALDRLRLVKPDSDQLVRGEDTLFRTRDGIEASADASVSTTSGALEASNVKAVDAMVRMLEYARHYETQVKMMKLSSENDQASARLMRMSGKFYLIRPLLVTPGHHLHP